MFDLDRWQEIFSALSKNKVRTFLTAFGVFWGIFMLLVMMGAGDGLEKGAKKDFGSFATNALYMWTQSTSKPYKGLPPGRGFYFNNTDTEAMRQNVDGIDILCPRNQLGGYRGENNVIRGKYVGAFSVYGDMPDIIKVDPLDVFEGRFLNQNDINEKRKVCVIGKRVFDLLFEKDEHPIGEYIQIKGVYFQVIGVYDQPFKNNSSERDLENIYIPFSTFQQAFNYGNVVGWYCVTAKPEVRVSQLFENIFFVLADRHKIHPEDTRAIGSWNSEKEFLKLNSLFIGINFLIWIVGIGTLLAGVIGVSNIMLVVVKERTKEIGIRKAIGANPYSIISQIILESTFLTSIAGYIGLLLGVLVIEIVNNLVGEGGNMFTNPQIDFNIAITATIILVVAGAFAGLIPARKAAAVNPVLALRNET
jgi:putative ABC transport system permease protein